MAAMSSYSCNGTMTTTVAESCLSVSIRQVWTGATDSSRVSCLQPSQARRTMVQQGQHGRRCRQHGKRKGQSFPLVRYIPRHEKSQRILQPHRPTTRGRMAIRLGERPADQRSRTSSPQTMTMAWLGGARYSSRQRTLFFCSFKLQTPDDALLSYSSQRQPAVVASSQHAGLTSSQLTRTFLVSGAILWNALGSP